MFTPRRLLFGRYSEAGFVFVFDSYLEIYGTRLSTGFHQQIVKKQIPGSSTEEASCRSIPMDFLRLTCLSVDEIHRLRQTCQTCATVRYPYNLKGMLCMHMSRTAREVDWLSEPDLGLERVTSLHNAQSLILILRESLERHHNPLMDPSISRFPSLHSNQTFVESIYDAVRPFSTPVLWDAVVCWKARNKLEGSGI